MEAIVPDWSAPSGVGAMVTVRTGGISVAPFDDGTGGGGLNLGAHVGDLPDNVLRNRALLQREVPSEPFWLAQVHGTRVIDAAAIDPNDVPQADAIVAAIPGAVCAVLTADCLPVLLADRAGKVVGAAHAGWRGLAHGVIENTIAAMYEKGATEIVAWLGPAIGPQRFEVGTDVRDAFVAVLPETAEAFAPIPERTGKYLADIYRLARLRLAKAGVTDCAGGGLCTVEDRSKTFLFVSARRHHRTNGNTDRSGCGNEGVAPSFKVSISILWQIQRWDHLLICPNFSAYKIANRLSAYAVCSLLQRPVHYGYLGCNPPVERQPCRPPAKRER